MKHDPFNNGQCCCTCKYQIKLSCHPWNEKFGRGAISEYCGWACIVMYEDRSNEGIGTFSDREHGLCELYTKRPNQ